MIISDGAPVDDSTLSVNPGNYLEQNLKETIHMIEKKNEIELLAIGIGHDVSRYYKRAITINEIDQLGEVLLNELSNIFSNDNAKTKKILIKPSFFSSSKLSFKIASLIFSIIKFIKNTLCKLSNCNPSISLDLNK